MLNALKIRKPPDEQRHRGEEVEDRVERLELGLDVLGLRLRASRPRRPCRSACSRRRSTVGDRLRRRPRRSRRPRRTRACLSMTLRAASSGITANPSPPNSKPLENWKRPTTSKRRSPSGVASETRSPTSMSFASAQLSWIAISARFSRIAARDRLGVGDVGRSRGPGRRRSADSRRRPAALAVALDQGEDARSLGRRPPRRPRRRSTSRAPPRQRLVARRRRRSDRRGRRPSHRGPRTSG